MVDRPNPIPSDQPEPDVAKKKVAKPAPKKTAAAKKKAPAPKKKATRVSKKSVNKSQMIRDYAAKHPKAGPTEISRELTKQGVKVSPPLVSNVLGASKRKKSKKRVSSRKAVGRPATTSDKVSLADLIATQDFVNKVGDIESAEGLLKAIKKLGN